MQRGKETTSNIVTNKTYEYLNDNIILFGYQLVDMRSSSVTRAQLLENE